MALEIVESVSSTMDAAREYLLAGRVRWDARGMAAPEGVLAWEQTAGRGQRGRNWYAPRGEALCVTYYFRNGKIDVREAGQISLLAGLAAAQALETDLPSSESKPAAREFGLKWPNDVLLRGKKVGGILTEMIRAQDGDWVALIGVGVNVNVVAFPPELAPVATSLLREGYGPYPVETVAEAIRNRLNVLADLRNHAGFAAIVTAWSAYDQTSGRIYSTEWEGKEVTGVPEGVDATGALLLRLTDGRRIAVLSASALQPGPQV